MSTQAPRRPLAQTKAAAAARAARVRAIVILTIALVAILVIVALVLANRTPQSASDAPIQASLKVGQTAPDFDVSTTAGPFDLKQNAGGKPTLVEIFATWCPHCQREAPLIAQLAADFKGRVNVVGVAGSPLGMDDQTPESQADVVNWTQQFGANYPVAFDPTLGVAKKYLHDGFPSLTLVGADGKILAMGSGEIPEKSLRAALQAAASGRTPSPTFGQKPPPTG